MTKRNLNNPDSFFANHPVETAIFLLFLSPFQFSVDDNFSWHRQIKQIPIQGFFVKGSFTFAPLDLSIPDKIRLSRQPGLNKSTLRYKLQAYILNQTQPRRR